MEEVVLSLGMVEVVVVDTDSRFRGVFEAMCKFLQITFKTLSRSNHKKIVLKSITGSLKKQAIAGQDRGSHDLFIQSAKKFSMRGTAPQTIILT